MINFKFDVQRFDSAFSGGNGTENNPYLISSLADLEQLRTDVNGGNGYDGKYLKVTKDITLSDNRTPIGETVNQFRGNFDGDGHNISGLKIYHTDHQLYDGLFGCVKNATIKNVNLTNVSIRSEHDIIGALIAEAYETQISNCTVQGNMEVGGIGAHVGGIIGNFFGGSMKNCAFIGTFKLIDGVNDVGIIAGLSLPWLGGNYYYGDYDNFNNKGATRIFNVNMPNGVTSDSIVTFVGKNYIKTGDVTFKYLGKTYKSNVKGDVTVKIDGNKFFVNDTDLGATFPVTLSGDGSEKNPFLIRTEDQLRLLAEYVNYGNDCAGLNFKLAKDINLTGDFTSIGDGSNKFSGTFDGDGKIISNLTVNGDDNQGLFGYTSGATIKNVRLTNANVTGGNYVGALVGTADNSTISNCIAQGNVKGSANVGGLVGTNTFGSITGSAFLGGTIDGTNKGAITGTNKGTLTENYYYDTLPEGVDANGAERVYRITAPDNVTSSSIVTITGTNFVKAGKATFTCNGKTYNYTVNEDIAVTVRGDNLSFGKIETSENFLATLEGNGSKNNPYLIATEKQFNQLANYVNYGNDCAGKNFKLTDDIALTENFTPIGDSLTPFKGNFDGDGKIISNLKINGDTYQGLFGKVSGATIKNVRLTNANVTGKDFVGAVVGYADNKTQVLNCTASGNVKATGNGANVGGLVGVIDDGTIKNGTYLGGTITGANKGAIVGKNDGTLTGNYYYGTLANGVNGNDAAQIFKATLPKGVTSSALVEIDGTKYIKAGNAIFTCNGKNFNYTVTSDVTVKIDGNKFFFNDTEYTANFPGNLDGNGSENNPYLIKTEADLREFATYVNGGNNCAGKNFKLANDIALTSNWTPVGTDSNKFSGTFDGDGKTIGNLKVDGDISGLFSYISDATVKNVNLTNVDAGGKYRIGALVGDAGGKSQILNCHASGNIKSDGMCSFVGGVVGYIANGITVDGCTFSGNVEGFVATDDMVILGSHVGGIVGFGNGGTVKNCAYLGDTLKSSDGGAITSRTHNPENFTNNYYYGKLADGVKDSGATQIFKATLPRGVTSNSIVEINGTKYIKAGDATFTYGGNDYSCKVSADLTVTIQNDKLSFSEQSTAAQGLKLYASDNGDILTGGTGNDSLWGGAGKDTFVHNGGNDIIYGFGDGDSLKINGLDEITANYDTANNDIKIPCGSTGSVTLKNFTTNEFAINSSTWTLNGSTLTKK